MAVVKPAKSINPSAVKYVEGNLGEIKNIVSEALRTFSNAKSISDDVVQQVCINLLTLRTFDSITNIRQYVRKSAIGAAIDMQRKHKSYESIHEVGAHLVDQRRGMIMTLPKERQRTSCLVAWKGNCPRIT